MDHGKQSRRDASAGDQERGSSDVLMEKHWDHSSRYPAGDERREFCDPTPLEVPLKFNRPQTLEERLMMMLRGEKLADLAARRGRDSFREFDDFEVDDNDPLSEHELSEMMEEAPIPLEDDVRPKGAAPVDPAPKEPVKEEPKEAPAPNPSALP